MATPPDVRPTHYSAATSGAGGANSGFGASSLGISGRKKRMAQLADIKANETLLACAVGDLPWLKRGMSSGANPKAINKDVSKASWRLSFSYTIIIPLSL